VVINVVGYGIWYLIGTTRKRTSQEPAEAPRWNPEKLEPVSPGILKCLELGDRVEEDASILASSLAAQFASIGGKVPLAANQLLETAGALTRQLRLVAESPPHEGADPVAAPAELATCNTTTVQNKNKSELGRTCSQLQVNGLERRTDKPERAGCDTREFPRIMCHALVKATIFPAPSSLSREPVSRMVYMRSISSGGLSFRYEERLYPRQIVVIEIGSKCLVGEIRWCKQKDGGFIAGCKLVSASS
jgi:hypothetical protein